MENLKREYTPRPRPGAAAALLLPRRRVPVLGPVRRATCTWSARPRAARCSCSAPTGSAATCSRASSTARASRSPSACIGIVISFVLGIVLGGLAGYYGGWVDSVDPARHRDHPLVPGAAAVDGAVGGAAGDLEPDRWSTSASPSSSACSTGPGLARAVRSKLLALREEDFCTAARADGRDARRGSSAATCCRAS